MTKIFMQISCALVILTCSFAAPDLSPGNAFPDLKLPSIAGDSSLSIEDFKGKKLMLHAFASW